MVLAADKVELDILPQNPLMESGLTGTKIVEVYTSGIGNMCLLHRSDNIRISNHEFTIKRKAIKIHPSS